MGKNKCWNESIVGIKKDAASINYLLPYLWPSGDPDSINFRVRVVIAVLLLIAAKFTNILVPLCYKYAVDSLHAPPNTILVVPISLLLAYGLSRVMAQAFGELRDAIFIRVAQRAVRKAGLKAFTHLHKLSLRFHLARKTGQVSRAVERGTKGIEFLLRFTLFNIAPTLFEVTLVCGILWFLYNIWFALITLITIFFYITFTLIVTEKRNEYRRDMNNADSMAYTRAIDSLLNFETVKYFSNEDHETNRFDKSLSEYENAATKTGTLLAFLNTGQATIIAMGLTLVMIMAANGVVDKTMTIGDFVLVNTYLIQLYLPLNFLGFVYREIKQALIDMEEMFKLSNESPEIFDAEKATSLINQGGSIRFSNVHFSYDNSRDILKGVSFEVPSGKTVAIVGSSGAGKSTIARLLFRFYDIKEGRITIDNQDIRELKQVSIRKAIGIVPQATVLFNDPILYNIAYANHESSMEEIEKATKHACIHDFINALPDGYDTLVGERGLKLSGGEKQRIAIARTILKNPEILIFDEATSALDSQTEIDIQKSLAEISSGRSTIIIAHRLSTIVHADEILVLTGGVICEQGTHRELIAKKGAYEKMWEYQQKFDTAKQYLHPANNKK